MNGKSRAKAKPESSLRQAIREAIVRIQKRDSAPYDGVRGLLPDWMPEPLRQEFHSHRGYLLDHYPHQDVLTYIEAVKELFNPETFRKPFYPIEDHLRLTALIYIKNLADLGPENGIAAYLGKGAFEVHRGSMVRERNRKAGKHPRQDALQKVIVQILDGEPEMTWKEVLREIEHRRGERVIDDVTDDAIDWTNEKGIGKSSPVSGLKDRVSRAKKKVNSL